MMFPSAVPNPIFARPEASKMSWLWRGSHPRSIRSLPEIGSIAFLGIYTWTTKVWVRLSSLSVELDTSRGRNVPATATDLLSGDQAISEAHGMIGASTKGEFFPVILSTMVNLATPVLSRMPLVTYASRYSLQYSGRLFATLFRTTYRPSGDICSEQ